MVSTEPDDLWLVVGLGNPGPDYAGNRHNVGFMVLDLLADRIGGQVQGAQGARRHRGGADRSGRRAVLAKPKSYMNLSGGPVAALRDFFKVPHRAHRGRPRRAGHPATAAAAQAGRRRQRSQRTEVDDLARSVPATTCGCGSASAGRPAGWTRPHSC